MSSEPHYDGNDLHATAGDSDEAAASPSDSSVLSTGSKSLAHEIATALMRRVVTKADPDEIITRTSYADELRAQGRPISGPTAARAATALILAGLLRDGPEVRRRRQGRPDKSLELDVMAIGVNVSDAPDYPRTDAEPPLERSRAARVYAGVVGFDGRGPASPEIVDVESPDAGALIEAIVTALSRVKWEYWEHSSAPRLGGVGIRIGGHVEEHRVLTFSPNVRFDGPLDLPALIREEVARRRAQSDRDTSSELLRRLDHIAAAPFSVDNDADADARYWTWFGRSRRQPVPMNFVFILLKLDGLGGSLVHNGQAAALSPFEIGHLVVDPSESSQDCRCGKTGCLEAVSTPFAMAKSIGIAGASVMAITNELFRRVDANDESALRAFDHGAATLGRVIANIMSLAGPIAVFVCAPEQLRSQRFTDGVRQAARVHTFPSMRDAVDISFEALPSPDEETASAAAQVIEQAIERFARRSDAVG